MVNNKITRLNKRIVIAIIKWQDACYSYFSLKNQNPMRKIIILMPALFSGLLLLTACSKKDVSDELQRLNDQSVKNLAVSPMPKDTLKLKLGLSRSIPGK